MQKEKRAQLILLAAVSILIIAITGYPAIRRQLKEQSRKDISLEETQDSAVTKELGRKQGTGTLQPSDNGTSNTAKMDLSDICLIPEDSSQDFKVSLWQSEAGICYFFLPGFAKGMGLLLENQDKNVYINDMLISETDVLRDIAADTSYDLLIQDHNGNELLHQSLIFMYSSDLPAMFLTTRSGSMDYIDADKKNEEAGSAALFDETGETLYTGSVKSMKGRGNSTWGLSKKPYQIKLQEEADLFGFGPSRSWNLLANAYDDTKLRNQIVSDLATELGMDYVPECQMIDLYINNIYYGNYYLTEKVRIGEENIAIRDMDTFVDDAYSASELEKLPTFQNEDGTRKWVDTDIALDDLSGGYLLERELSSRFETDISGFITKQGDCYTLRSPAYASQEQVNYIADLMQEFEDAVGSADGIHPVTGKHYSEYIDINSFVQKYLVEEISKNYDGGVTSSFFYKPQDVVSSQIFAGPVWDYDVAFGNCNLDKIASNPLGITRLDNHIYSTPIFARLYEKEDFHSAVTAMYEIRALPYLNHLLEYGIDEMVSQSRASVAMDCIRWETRDNRYQYYKEYDNSVRYLKYFIEQRRDFLNEVWLEDVRYYNVNFVVDDDIWQIFCVRDGDLPPCEPTPVRYNSLSLFLGWVNEYGVPYDMYKPVYEDMTFYATWQELPDIEANHENGSTD